MSNATYRSAAFAPSTSLSAVQIARELFATTPLAILLRALAGKR